MAENYRQIMKRKVAEIEARERKAKEEANKKYLQSRIAEAAELVLTFNTKHKDSLVYLKISDQVSGSFGIHFKLNDKFINPKYYEEGSAVIYPSDAVYEEIQKLAGDREVQWNNTGSTGWLSYYKVK